LGTFTASDDGKEQPEQAILLVEKTHFPEESLPDLSTCLLKLQSLGQNDIYTWLHGWLVQNPATPDVKMTLIRPATATVRSGPPGHEILSTDSS
jgi:hypothetical protein